jgi:FixJ family two-component response regulator
MSDEKTAPVILLVDDEEMILTSIKAFFAIETDYEFLTYTSPLEAVRDLKTKIRVWTSSSAII